MASLDVATRRSWVEPQHQALSVRRQCQLLSLSRSTLYYRPVPEDPQTLEIMAHLDRHYLEDPTAGSRRMQQYLRRDGFWVGRDRVRHLMQRMGLRAIYRKPRTTIPGQPSQRFPCLVQVSALQQPDQAWGTDITYIPMRRGFLYLVAVLDLFSRACLAWELSNSLDVEFCRVALERALHSGHVPEIFHSDQGCQFTSHEFIGRLESLPTRISWSGCGRCYDNILVERFWRTLKYEEVFLRAYEDPLEAFHSLDAFIDRYNHHRPHQALGYRTPYEVYTQVPVIQPVLS